MLIVSVWNVSSQIGQASLDSFILDGGGGRLQRIPDGGLRAEDVGDGASRHVDAGSLLVFGLQNRSDDSPAGKDDSTSGASSLGLEWHRGQPVVMLC